MNWLMTFFLLMPMSATPDADLATPSTRDHRPPALATLAAFGSDFTLTARPARKGRGHSATGGDFTLSTGRPTEKAASGCPCQPREVPLFTDGFESGDTGAWTRRP